MGRVSTIVNEWARAEDAQVAPGYALANQAPPSDVQGGNQEVNILTTRFGLIQACETDLILVPEGLLGFRAFTHYIHLPDPVVDGLSWLQSVTAADLAFGLVAPPLAVSDYRVELRQGDRTALELEDERSAMIYVI